jgi:DNA repair protein RAD16
MKNYVHIFVLLLKLRQAVCHPFMVAHSNGCGLCSEPVTEMVQSSCCRSGFCTSCVDAIQLVSNNEEALCPKCGKCFAVGVCSETKGQAATATQRLLTNMCYTRKDSILRRIDLEQFATSTKIEVLIQELMEMRMKRPGSKALVFSQFVTMLDLVRWRLESDPCMASSGLGVNRLHGGMSMESRNEAIREFQDDSSCRVLLMSLKAAGVALNLTVASECYILDPWWNPAAEMQAIDRTHRIGQYRPIRVVRLIAEGTIEERILQLQEKKRLVFDATIGRDDNSLGKLTLQDMAQLFQ